MENASSYQMGRDEIPSKRTPAARIRIDSIFLLKYPLCISKFYQPSPRTRWFRQTVSLLLAYKFSKTQILGFDRMDGISLRAHFRGSPEARSFHQAILRR